MWFYAAQRILYAVPIAIGVTVICFGLVYLAPGDPVQMLLPPDASQADVEFLKKLYGFDQPIPIQYFKWLARAVNAELTREVCVLIKGSRSARLERVVEALVGKPTHDGDNGHH